MCATSALQGSAMTLSQFNQANQANQARHAGPAPRSVQIPKPLLDRLDDLALRQLRENPSASRRAHARYRYRHHNVRIILTHVGGGQTFHSVCTRNISAGGLAFL